MPVLYFIRHGETDWNREGRLQGQTDTPINALGRRQAAAAAKHLADAVPAPISRLPFIASPMRRTRETMEIVREELALPLTAYETDPRLIEIGFGRWEGKTWKEVRQADPGGASGRHADKWGFVPPGGENYEMVKGRVADWLKSVDEDCVLVAHGGIARVLMVLLCREAEAKAVLTDIWQGKVLRFDQGAARWLPGPGHV